MGRAFSTVPNLFGNQPFDKLTQLASFFYSLKKPYPLLKHEEKK
jgi:hypothetical protein